MIYACCGVAHTAAGTGRTVPAGVSRGKRSRLLPSTESAHGKSSLVPVQSLSVSVGATDGYGRGAQLREFVLPAIETRRGHNDCLGHHSAKAIVLLA